MNLSGDPNDRQSFCISHVQEEDESLRMIPPYRTWNIIWTSQQYFWADVFI